MWSEWAWLTVTTSTSSRQRGYPTWSSKGFRHHIRSLGKIKLETGVSIPGNSHKIGSFPKFNPSTPASPRPGPGRRAYSPSPPRPVRIASAADCRRRFSQRAISAGTGRSTAFRHPASRQLRRKGFPRKALQPLRQVVGGKAANFRQGAKGIKIGPISPGFHPKTGQIPSPVPAGGAGDIQRVSPVPVQRRVPGQKARRQHAGRNHSTASVIISTRSVASMPRSPNSSWAASPARPWSWLAT